MKPLAVINSTSTVLNTSHISIAPIETQIQNIRDRIQGHTTNSSSSRFGYADDDSASDALGYSAVNKAPPFFKAPKPVDAPYWSAWGQAFGDYEIRNATANGVDVSRNTSTFGGVGGVDVTIPHFGISDALVVGLVAGDTEAHVYNADGSSAHLFGPGVGTYGTVVIGGFSADSVLKADFFDLDNTAAGVTTPLRVVNLTSASNLNYKIDRGSWWYEPTAGITYTHTGWDNASLAATPGLTDGTQWRWQAGARVGTSFMVNGVNVTPTLTGLVYDDFSITGGTIATATTPLVPTFEGRIFGQLIGRVNVDWNKNLSSYVEGEVRGSNDVLGVAGRVGVRYSFDPAH